MDARDVIRIGMSAERTLVVPPERTVGHFVPGMPMVYATPMMILEMEMASGDAIRGHLQPGWVTVGTEVDIRHLAAALVGATVRTTAKVIAVERRVIRFEVEAFRRGERKIGEGRHARGLVNVASFNKRLGGEVATLIQVRERVRKHGHCILPSTPRRCAAPRMRAWRNLLRQFLRAASSPPRPRGSSAAACRPGPSALPAPRPWCRRAR